MLRAITELVRWVGYGVGATLIVSIIAVCFGADWHGWITLGVWSFLAMIPLVPLGNLLTGTAPEPLFTIATRKEDDE
jgi:hypothetical protein